MPEFAYTDLLPLGPDATDYRLLTADGITRRQAFGRDFLEVDPEVLTLVAREGMRDIGEGIRRDLLSRYASVGSRLDRLYKIVFAATYWSDLSELGFERVVRLLQFVQKRRNEFAHGQPAAIDEGLIKNLVEALKDEHEAWIAVFNRRATRCPPAVNRGA